MYSNIVPFESILDIVQDDTGIKNLRNARPQIRRFIYRVEKDLGYGDTLLLRKVKFKLSDNTILFDGEQYKLKLPNDVVRLEAIGMCQTQRICPGDYRIQGQWMFFCKGKKVEELQLLYYALLHDGEGNPVITENHSEAIAAGISYFIMRQGAFAGKRNAGLLREFKEEYYDRLAEARGDDVWPNTVEEWEKLGLILNRSYRDTLIYSKIKRCFCEVAEATLTTEVIEVGTPGGGGGFTNPDTTVPGGGGAGTGSSGPDPDTGVITDPNTGEVIPEPDGGYNPPTDPTDPTDPNPEPGNSDPTIDDITIYTTSGFTRVITYADFVSGAPAPYNDADGDLMDAVRFDGLKPDNKGKYFFQGAEIGTEVAFGAFATKANIEAGDLIHIAWAEEDFNHDILYFSVRDSVNGNWIS